MSLAGSVELNRGPRAPRVPCSAPARQTGRRPQAQRLRDWRKPHSDRRGAGRNTRGRVCSPKAQQSRPIRKQPRMNTDGHGSAGPPPSRRKVKPMVCCPGSPKFAQNRFLVGVVGAMAKFDKLRPRVRDQAEAKEAAASFFADKYSKFFSPLPKRLKYPFEAERKGKP